MRYILALKQFGKDYPCMTAAQVRDYSHEFVGADIIRPPPLYHI
jgi:hypothetical protein